ncbi:MFS transporter [Thermomonas sp.]|uniref:MFS transporter n=1 Tax=Thermomonas sp. TaxID=1971895 RepID=UPI001EBFBBE7|nr:MFS transporter [Thermomonas sp.]MBK6417330.1 MFS transporter [Thermomonas sp.]MBK7206299.1 MFS transporter [Thermomonas sp.]MBL0227427.1 MFS transporter [Thermomonas sp.]HQX93441.1 MFS transporter [Thermomonas sp.]HQY81393.1 MFS transporter [Thermomonas sp.]
MTPHATPALSRAQLKTLALASLGAALEFYDFVIFVFFAATMGALFFPADMPEWLRLVQTFGIFAAGYLARPLGGIVMAHFGDLSGRKRMFMLSILMMAIPTLLMGLLPTYAQAGVLAPILLLLLRIMQGAAIGGEAPGAWVFVSEHVPPRHRTLACGALSAGLCSGILIGSLVARATDAMFDQAEVLAWGWRLPFIVGGVFGLLAMVLRRQLHETPVFTELRARRALAAELPLKTVVRDHAGAVLLAMLLTWLLTAAVVVTLLMMPTLLQGLGVSRADALAGNTLAIFATVLANLAAGWLADRFGPGRVLVLWSASLGAAFWLFYGNALAGAYSPALYVVAGASVGLTALVPALAVGGFPPQVRFSGLSFAYNLAYAIAGGLTPVLLSLAIRDNPAAPMQYIAAMAVLGIALGLYLSVRPPRHGAR